MKTRQKQMILIDINNNNISLKLKKIELNYKNPMIIYFIYLIQLSI